MIESRRSWIVTFVFVLSLVVLPGVNPVRAGGSNDLGKLAYISEGNLWVRELPNGQAMRLTADGGYTSPQWSPSGTWVVVRQDRGRIQIMRETGDGATVLQDSAAGATVAWSPVTDTLAFSTSSGNLAIASAPDWHPRPVATVQDEEGSAFPMAWSPDGEWIAFLLWHALPFTSGGDTFPPNVSLSKVRPDGRDLTELLNAGDPADHGLQLAGWSRDGSELYYYPDPAFSASLLADGSELWAVKTDGSRTTRRLAPTVLLVPDFWDESPDGKALAVAEGIGRETWSHKRIALVDLESGQLTYLTDTNTAAFSPAWSPDGKRLAYVAARDVGSVGGGPPAKAAAAERRIWTTNADGSAQSALTNDPAYRDEFPQWSRDGQFILFARMDAVDTASIWLVLSNGGVPDQVASGLGPDISWFGYYGYINWANYYSWWTGK